MAKSFSIFLATLEFLMIAPLCFGDECKVLSKEHVGEALASDSAYFLPSSGITSYLLNGLLFMTKQGLCCRLTESEDGRVEGTQTQCKPEIKLKALAEYSNISDFKAYKSRFLACQKNKDRDCLRPLISRRFQASFGYEGYGDLRELALSKWTDADFAKMQKLLEAGITVSGDRRLFPLKPDNDGMGWRGSFLLTKSGWLLESFLAGD